jgi:hypothetical protein
VIVLNPALESVPPEAQLAPRPDSLAGLTVGFLDNGKPMADVFLQELAEVMEKRYGLEALLEGKADPSRVVSPGQLTSLAARSHAIITGVGD